jgi:hypothetical protein
VVAEDPMTAVLPEDREALAQHSGTEMVASPCKEGAAEHWAPRKILLLEAHHCRTPATTVGDTAAETEVR